MSTSALSSKQPCSRSSAMGWPHAIDMPDEHFWSSKKKDKSLRSKEISTSLSKGLRLVSRTCCHRRSDKFQSMIRAHHCMRKAWNESGSRGFAQSASEPKPPPSRNRKGGTLLADPAAAAAHGRTCSATLVQALPLSSAHGPSWGPSHSTLRHCVELCFVEPQVAQACFHLQSVLLHFPSIHR